MSRTDHLTVDVSELKSLERQLGKFAKVAFPAATKETLNDLAFTMRREWQEEIRAEFTNRNQFTVRSIRVDQCKSLVVNDQVATVGSVTQYMDEQEEGATLTGKGSGAKAIPLPLAAGQSGTGARTKLLRKPNYLSAIHLGARAHKGNKKQANAIAISTARKAGKKVVYLEFGDSRGLYRIGGGKKNAKVKRLWNFSHKSVNLKPRPTMERAREKTLPRMDRLYHRALTKQLRRHNLFGA